MTITTRDKLIDALANSADRIIIDKASIANQTVGGFTSFWRATGQPAQGAIPTTAAIPTNATTGAIGFVNQTSPITNYIAWLFCTASTIPATMEIHDRLAHMGGLSLALTSSQTVTGMDLSASGLNVPAARLGANNYSDVQWWLEVYADGGATASNATINVTYDDASSANLTVQAVGGTLRASRMLPLTPLIPVAQQGKFIRAVNSVVLSANTLAAGNFGFTATRPRTVVPLILANKAEIADWAQLGLPEVANNACLQIIMVPGAAATGTLRGGGKIIHG